MGSLNDQSFFFLLDPFKQEKKSKLSIFSSNQNKQSTLPQATDISAKQDSNGKKTSQPNQAESKKQNTNNWFMTTETKDDPLAKMNAFTRSILNFGKEEEKTQWLAPPTQKERDFAESFLGIDRKEDDTRDEPEGTQSGFRQFIDTSNTIMDGPNSIAKNFNRELGRFSLSDTRNVMSPGSRTYAPNTILVDNRLYVPSKKIEQSQAYKKAMEVYKELFPESYKKSMTPGKIRLSNGTIEFTGAKELLKSDSTNAIAKKAVSALDGAQLPKPVRSLLKNADDLAKFKSIAKSGGKALGIVGGALSLVDFGLTVYEDMTDEDGKPGQKTKNALAATAADAIGGAVGTRLGAIGGAAIGGMICPVLGVPIGGFIGGIAGGALGSLLASHIAGTE